MKFFVVFFMMLCLFAVVVIAGDSDKKNVLKNLSNNWKWNGQSGWRQLNVSRENALAEVKKTLSKNVRYDFKKVLRQKNKRFVVR